MVFVACTAAVVRYLSVSGKLRLSAATFFDFCTDFCSFFCWISLFDVHRTKKKRKKALLSPTDIYFYSTIFLLSVALWLKKPILKYLVNPAGVVVQYCKENRQQLTPFFLRFFLPLLLLCGLPDAVASNSHPPPHPLLPKKEKKAKRKIFSSVKHIESERCQCQVYPVLERKNRSRPSFPLFFFWIDICKIALLTAFKPPGFMKEYGMPASN